MQTLTTRIAVVGLGAWGSAALWRLAARGIDAIGIDRYGVGHHLGSSHGATRLFRVACQEHPGLAPIAQRSLALWQELGERTGERYVMQTGCLSTGVPSSAPVAGTRAAARAAGIEVEDLTHAELAARFPQYTGLRSESVGVIDPAAGLCFPERNIRAMGTDAARLGARILADSRVTGLELVDGGVRLHTATAVIEAEQAIITAGAWNPTLIPGLPLSPRRTPLFWFQPKDGAGSSFALEDFPAFVHELSDGRLLWGHGSYDGPEGSFGVKIGMEGAGAGFVRTTADGLDRYIHPREDLAVISAWVAEAFEDIDPVPAKAIPCMVTDSPDAQFLLGRPGGDSRLVLGGGDSGHGFKHAAGIGELLAQIAAGEAPYTDVEFLDPDRFAEVGRAVAGLARG